MLRFVAIIVMILFVSQFSRAQMNVNFTVDTTVVCVGYPVQFTDNTIADTLLAWSWQFGDGATDTVQNPSHVYIAPGIYSVTLSATSSNTTKSKVKANYILVRATPELTMTSTDTLFVPSFLFQFNASVINHDTLPYQYFWNFDSMGFIEGDSSELYTFPSDNSFIVAVVVEAGGGCRDTVVDTLTVVDDLEAPNVFSPNNDGNNDVFLIVSNGVTVYDFVVYNRWGVIMYQVRAKRIVWDGRSSAGVEIPGGTYYYNLSPADNPGVVKSGVFLLLR